MEANHGAGLYNKWGRKSEISITNLAQPNEKGATLVA